MATRTRKAAGAAYRGARVAVRQIADWERCAQNMSGVHTWSIQKEEPAKTTGSASDRKGKAEHVACHRCKALPPTIHRARLYDEIKAALEIDRKQRALSKAWRESTQPRRATKL